MLVHRLAILEFKISCHFFGDFEYFGSYFITERKWFTIDTVLASFFASIVFPTPLIDMFAAEADVAR